MARSSASSRLRLAISTAVSPWWPPRCEAVGASSAPILTPRLRSSRCSALIMPAIMPRPAMASMRSWSSRKMNSSAWYVKTLATSCTKNQSTQ